MKKYLPGLFITGMVVLFVMFILWWVRIVTKPTNDYTPDQVNSNIALKSVIKLDKYDDIYLYEYRHEDGLFLISKGANALSVVKIK